MNWTDIQIKWAAMARRVQSDPSPDGDATATSRLSDQPMQRDGAAELRTPPPNDRSVV
ncbi:MAG: hypothetical protein WCS20_05320 [Alphaproteobacteria bacterium]|jgi:hypothetical protein